MSAITVIDPRMPRHPNPVVVTRRTGEPPARILLLDNGQLGTSVSVFDAMEDLVREMSDDVVVRRDAVNLLSCDDTEIRALARHIVSDACDGVVIGLCHWGVTQASVLLAAELESLGVPTCLVTTEPGTGLARCVASITVPRLPIVDVVESEAAASVVKAITAPADIATRTSSAPVDLPTAGPDRRMTLRSNDAVDEFTSLMAEDGLGDGFPLVPPTPDRVDAMLAAMGIDGDEPIWPTVVPRPAPVVATDVAVIAVMAGVPLRSAPVVLAAYRAMAATEFRLFQAAITTHPSGVLVLVSGPRSDELGIVSGRGCLGPGFRGNASVGRAVSLGFGFLLGAIPGRSELTSQGSPAQYSFCCAENIAESPWPGLHHELGFPDDTTVTVLVCEGPHCLTDDLSSTADGLVETFASSLTTLGANTAYVSTAQVVVFLNPDHAELITADGWTKDRFRRELFEASTHDRAATANRGLVQMRPESHRDLDRYPVVPAPDDFLIVLAGGSGPASQAAIPWGLSRGVTRPIDRQTRGEWS
jgi:hypothetical protein